MNRPDEGVFGYSASYDKAMGAAFNVMKSALTLIAKDGCSRLTPPSTCRKPNGYPEREWCDGCLAARGLGLPVEWFVIR